MNLENRQNYLQFLILIILCFSIGCSTKQNSAKSTVTETNTIKTKVPTSTKTPSLTPSFTLLPPTLTSTNSTTPTQTNPTTRTPTPTFVPQILGRVFSDEYHGQAVWSNESHGWEKDYLKYARIDEGGSRLHFDVSLPTGHGIGKPVISPINGYIEKVFSIGDEGFVVNVIAEPRFLGYEELAEIVGYESEDVLRTKFHFGHITPLVQEGDEIVVGQVIGDIFDTPFQEKLAYVVIIQMRDGKEFQFSPCDIPNTAEFCGKCEPNTPLNCP